jgi:MYXO-CTERM domain-containing protein
VVYSETFTVGGFMTAQLRVLITVLTTVSAAAMAQVTQVGDILVVQDPSGAINQLIGMDNMSIFPSKQEQFCRASFNAVRAAGLPDLFDGVITFTASESLTDIDNVWQGSPVRSDGSGYGRTNAAWANTYNSTKLGQCVFMGTLGRTQSFFGGPGPEALPSNPDSDWAPSLGIQIPGITSLTGIEMMGHEYGHHWLMGVEFDQNDGRNRQHFIRGFSGSDDMGQGGSPNQHYSHYADSRSVMYGSCIRDLGNGSYEVKGCERKYSQIDQYLMGLRDSTEVAPMLVLEDPSDPGRGVDTVAYSRSSSGTTVNGWTRHDITADEIVRAMGARIPASPTARRCWRVAFIVVLAPGQTAMTQAMLDKVNRYRNRWGPWFNFATDGRGTMDSRITGNGCVTFPGSPDAGVVVEVDAGVTDPDAGVVVEPDAGMTVEPDAGTVEEPDAGQPMMGQPDAGPSKEDTRVPFDTGKIRPGCGCSTPGGGELFALLAGVIALARRRRFS